MKAYLGFGGSSGQARGLGKVVTLMGAALIAAVLLLPGELTALQSGTVLADQGGDAALADPNNLFRVFHTATGDIQTVKGPNCLNTPTQAGVDVCTTSNPFIAKNFGTAFGNGQDCETCHQPQLGWSVTPQFLAERFVVTGGSADQFRVNDTATDPRICGTPTATTSQAQNAANVNACVAQMNIAQKIGAYHLFVELGIHRIAIKDNPALDDFTISAPTTREFGVLPIPAGQDSQQPCSVQVPTGVGTCLPTVSVFRRPLMTTNTFFDSSVLWDGRQNVCVAPTPAPGLCPSGANQPIRAPLLENQVAGAAQTLVLSAPTTTLQEDQAAHFMTGIFTAMVRSENSGRLDANGANGGPQFLADMASLKQTPPCTPLVEAPTSLAGAGAPPPACSTTRGFDIYQSFLPQTLQANATTPAGIQAIFAFCNNDAARQRAGNAERVAIACGENIFDNRPINDPVVGRAATTTPPTTSFGSANPPNARCTSCHSATDVADNPSPAFIISYTPNGGTAQNPALFVGGATLASGDAFCATHPTDPFCSSTTFKLPEFKQRTSQLPLYTLTQTGTGKTIQLTDPGQALITHAFGNAGGQKPPVLRNLAARAPYFHNGSAETLDDLVDFYNQNFSIGLSPREHSDLVSFLKAL
jgi:cytochrome c peroxidase